MDADMPAVERWTPETEAAVVAAIRDEAKHYPGTLECEDRCVQDETVCMTNNIHAAWSVDGVIGSVYAGPTRLAKVALAALAEAGLLLPPGGEDAEEWGTRHLDIESGRHVEQEWVDRPAAIWAFHRLVEVWGHHAQLIRRSVITTPWIEVTPDA